MSAADRFIQVAHPWHGIAPRVEGSDLLRAYIEIVPGADLKFELDKPTGWLRIDRPQQFASRPPAMYGLIPQTYCAEQVGTRCSEMTGLTNVKGDGDPMDIVVLAERAPSHGGFLLHARAIGGIRMIDRSEADDKIIAVLDGDPVFGHCNRIGDAPKAIIDHLVHYFSTYKQPPGDKDSRVAIRQVYDHDEAQHMIALSLVDYSAHFLADDASGGRS